jgi:micrococcal nuclease
LLQRMIVSLKQFFLLILLASAMPGVCFAVSRSAIVGTPAQFEESAPQAGELRKVVRVVDGDTIVVSPNERVRLIGVNTPETKHPKKPIECFGKEASQFTRDAVDGKTIRLVMDPVNTKRRHKDHFGRTLAYAYLEDGTMLNRELIRRGYAPAEIRFPFRYLAEFRELEHQALTQTVGLWSSCSLNEQ